MSRAGKLAPEVNRALFVKNLSYNVTPEDLFELFGKFGPIRQVRQGIATNTKGTAFVVYEDVMDAKQACDKLNGFNFQGRYLVVLYHQPEKMARSKEDLEARKENLAQLKQKHDPSLSSTTTNSSSSTAASVTKATSPPIVAKKTVVRSAVATAATPRKGRPDDVANQARRTVLSFVRGFLPQKTSNKVCMT
ncbi:hypothetical protein JX265_010228 [Neoarthrinium moseri]|uniref:RRM domain-containing protein n=1 Tax=Neoarthrinium moseri TaxID=1658444 RepID=A0A9P9WEI9_9PEZI|nr:uncharacterized protein JN550_010468 [Neoarthrinium moseri]KAI1859779.1 hypothetical protein JX265_010228 [Neoarthrinium moseri]KAI1862165.1 hypothetical protein JN550_010468 [Neoarthrinium moseri]